MVTISVKDYNEIVRNSCDRRVIEALKFIINCILKDSAFIKKYDSDYKVVDALQDFVKNLQSKECSFEEVMMRFKNDLLHESTEEDKEGRKYVERYSRPSASGFWIIPYEGF